MTLDTLAQEIFLELDSPTDITEASIQFWLETNVGKLNLLLDTDFSFADGVVSPDLDNQEQGIFKQLYIVDYLNRQVKKNLGAAAYSTILEVKEGNRTVKRQSRTNVSKEYAIASTEAKEELMFLVTAYKMNQSDATQYIVPNPIETDCYYDRILDPRNYPNP